MSSAPVEAVAQTSLLIRKPPAVVFRYFVEPELLTRFWLAKASAQLEAGSSAHWDFLVPGAADDVLVEALQEPSRLTLKSSDGSRITWTFTEHAGDATRVHIEQRGFPGTPEEAVSAAVEAAAGFTLVLAELKLLLEQGRAMGLVRDKAQLIGERLSQQA